MDVPSLLVSHWRPDAGLEVVAALYATAYLGAAARLADWPRRRTASFLGGIAVTLMALQSGLDSYDTRLLSAHMAQHMLLLVVAPALLVAGHPALLALRALPARWRASPARALARLRPLTAPFACMGMFYATLLLTHLPGFYEAALRHPALHAVEHALYMTAGSILWWPLLGGDPLPSRRLGGLGALLYVLVSMPPMALLGAYLNRSAGLLYPSYRPNAAQLGVSPLADQAQAGAIMWVVGDTIMVFAGLGAVLAVMVGEERRLRAREARIPRGSAGSPKAGR